MGRERIEETIDPELTIDRALETYLKKGYSREWINQRLQAIQVRKELTDEWDARGVQKGVEYAILTDEISRAWSGMTTRQYKTLKGLTKENLRDNMTTLELVLNMLAEATTTEISKQKEPVTFSENIETARAGGKVAGDARKAIEAADWCPSYYIKECSPTQSDSCRYDRGKRRSIWRRCGLISLYTYLLLPYRFRHNFIMKKA